MYTDFPRERTFLNKHGIRFVVMQTGQLGEFDVTTLLLQLTTRCVWRCRVPRVLPLLTRHPAV